MPEVPNQQNIYPPLDRPPQPAVQTAAIEHSPLPPPTTKFKKKWALIAGILLGIAMITAVSLWLKYAKASPPATLTKISVRLEWVNNPEFAGMYVAQDLGYYKAVGLQVELKEFQNSTDVNKEVASGAVDYGVSTPLEVVFARDKSENNKAIAAYYQTSPYSIAVLRSSGIKTPADFVGKTLGDSGGNNEAKVTYAILAADAGLDPARLNIQSVGFDPVEVFNDSQAQTYDIYRTDETYLLNKAKIAYTQIFPEQFGFNIYGDVLIASDKTIAQKPAQTQALVNATMKGWQYAIDHPDQALTILSHHMNAIYSDPAYIKYVFDNSLPLIKTTGGQPLGDMQYVYWNRAYIGASEAGLLKTGFSPSDLYTNQFVK